MRDVDMLKALNDKYGPEAGGRLDELALGELQPAMIGYRLRRKRQAQNHVAKPLKGLRAGTNLASVAGEAGHHRAIRQCYV